jgi:hypothetical protein
MPDIRLRIGTRKRGTCSAPTCRAALDWYQTPKDRAMPMNAGATATRLERDGDLVIGVFDGRDSHWATCPARDRFHRARR